jgi:hypothetical protein
MNAQRGGQGPTPYTGPPGGGAPQGAPPAPQGGPAAAGAAAGAGAGPPAGGLDFGDLAPTTVDPKAIVRNVAQSSGWQVQEDGDVWEVVVPIGTLRKQTVTVDFSTKDEGHAVIAYRSVCGPASEQNALTLLKYNTRMVHGAFAVESTDSGDMVVLQANQLADTADVLEVTRVVTALAWQADKVEQKLVGGDQF